MEAADTLRCCGTACNTARRQERQWGARDAKRQRSGASVRMATGTDKQSGMSGRGGPTRCPGAGAFGVRRFARRIRSYPIRENGETPYTGLPA